MINDTGTRARVACSFLLPLGFIRRIHTAVQIECVTVRLLLAVHAGARAGEREAFVLPAESSVTFIGPLF